MSHRPGHRAYLVASLFAVALLALPFLFWYDTWFGRRLTDAQISEYLAGAESQPRRAQHALVQIGQKLSRGDAAVERWYPGVTGLARSGSVELRQTAAWIMGQDRRYAPFRTTLHEMLGDPSELVRRNAALSLAALRDPAGRPELRAMLEPYTLASPFAGTVRFRLKSGEYVNAGTLVARVGEQEVRAPVPGRVRSVLRTEGVRVAPGDPLLEISPDETHVWEGLRALYLVGEPADAETVQRYARGVPDLSGNVRTQALMTLRAIRTRTP